MRPAALVAVLTGSAKLINTEEAAKMSGVSLRRFHQLREENRIPAAAISHGRIVRYFDTDFDSL